MVTVWVEGVEELNTVEQAFARAGGRIGEKGARVVRAAALRVEATAKLFCPVDTGHLQSTIGVDYHGDGRSGAMEAAIGPTASYGGFVEFGTSRMAPHAYMGPALDRVAPDYVSACQRLAVETLGFG